MITRFDKLTDEEFLSDLTVSRQYSPVIDELCTRLEKAVLIPSDCNHRVECPCCEAQLLVDLDINNTMFTVMINKEI